MAREQFSEYLHFHTIRKNLGCLVSKQMLGDLTFWRSRQDGHPILLVNNGIHFVLLRVLHVAAHYGQRTISRVISWLVIL